MLSLSVRVVEDFSGFDSEHSVNYSDKEIICHFIPASTSQTRVTQVSNSCPDVPSGWCDKE